MALMPSRVEVPPVSASICCAIPPPSWPRLDFPVTGGGQTAPRRRGVLASEHRLAAAAHDRLTAALHGPPRGAADLRPLRRALCEPLEQQRARLPRLPRRRLADLAWRLALRAFEGTARGERA